MTSGPTGSLTSIGYAVREVRPSPQRNDIGASTPDRLPQASEPSPQKPVRDGANFGYSGERGQSERGRIFNFRI
jgi:hypothetical protein